MSCAMGEGGIRKVRKKADTKVKVEVFGLHTGTRFDEFIIGIYSLMNHIKVTCIALYRDAQGKKQSSLRAMLAPYLSQLRQLFSKLSQ